MDEFNFSDILKIKEFLISHYKTYDEKGKNKKKYLDLLDEKNWKKKKYIYNSKKKLRLILSWKLILYFWLNNIYLYLSVYYFLHLINSFILFFCEKVLNQLFCEYK